MEIFRYEGHNVYQLINGKLVVIKRKNKIKFWFRGIGFKNLKFTVSPHRQLRYKHIRQISILYNWRDKYVKQTQNKGRIYQRYGCLLYKLSNVV
jgi:hypothetical protein